MTLITSDTEAVISGVESYTFAASATGAAFRILTGACPVGDGSDAIPVYVPDAAMSFGSAVETVRLLQLMHHLPSVLIIGIGYPVEGIAPSLPLRMRDLTPTADSTRVGVAAAMMGGADRFLDFVRDDLQPWVRDSHAVRTGQDTYFGHSLGALFGAHVLFTAPDTFRRYGLGSPSLWWDDGVAWREESAYARDHTNLVADVFLSVGGDEDSAGAEKARARLAPEERAAAAAGPAPKDMVGDMRRMATLLESRGYSGLRVGSLVLPGEDHASSQPMNLSRALRFLLGPDALPAR